METKTDPGDLNRKEKRSFANNDSLSKLNACRFKLHPQQNFFF